MKNYFFSIWALFISISLYSQKIYSTNNSYQADLKVFVVKQDYQADLRVFNVKQSYKAMGNDGLWFFVSQKYQAEKKVIFVDYEYQADLKVFFVEYQHQSGWKNSEKKHLLY